MLPFRRGQVAASGPPLVADVRIRYPWAWVALLALIVPGAGLMTSSDPVRVRIGIALILAPILITGAIMAIYYVRSRAD